MTSELTQYEQWLCKTDEERAATIRQWNVYKREGFNVALMASARLAFASDCKIMDAQITTQHGGTWSLLMTTDKQHENDHPQPSMFEGFAVFWSHL